AAPALPLDGNVRLGNRDYFDRLQISVHSHVGRFRIVDQPEPALAPFVWGANTFSVFFPACPYHLDERLQQVEALVEQEKPAHTSAELCPVLPRLRAGVQATLGIDTVVAD